MQVEPSYSERGAAFRTVGILASLQWTVTCSLRRRRAFDPEGTLVYPFATFREQLCVSWWNVLGRLRVFHRSV